MTGPRHMLDFSDIISLSIVIIASIFVAEFFDFVIVVIAGEFSNYFFCYIATNVLSIIGWVFLLFFFNFTANSESLRVCIILRVID